MEKNYETHNNWFSLNRRNVTLKGKTRRGSFVLF